MGKKKKSKGGSFLMQGSILAAAGIITKSIGAVYRIPMLNIMAVSYTHLKSHAEWDFRVHLRKR